MKRTCFLIFAAFLTLTSAAYSQQSIWAEQKLTTGSSQWRGGAKVWNQTAYYGDMGTTGSISSVYSWTQGQGSRLLLGGDGISRAPAAVWGDTLVMNEVVNNQYDIYLYDPVNGRRPLTTAPGDQYHADIYQTTVVYEDHSGTVSQVKIWDPVSGERIVSASNSAQSKPKIWGSVVTWEQATSGTPHVWKWDPVGGAVDLGEGYSPAVYDGKVVGWQPAYYPVHGGTSQPGELWEWTASGGKRNLWTNAWNNGITSTEMWGTTIAFQYGGSPCDIGSWDPVHGMTWVNQSHQGYSSSPSVYGNTIAWVGGNDVYISTLVPEPSGILPIASLLMMLGMVVQRARAKRRTN